MVAYDNIAIFILATTLRNSIVNRIVPIASTWGADFPYLYFVMGTNDIDKQFLDRQCSPYRELGHRSLANAKQVPHRNELLEYRCPAPPASDLQVLFTANCTGTYFGLGPTCRCEESMRFFTTAPRFRRTEWFMFIDDDLFVRSAPFNSFLSGFDRVINQSITILRYATSRQFSNPKLSNRTECFRRFRLAMPSIMNRKALSELSSTITANGMVRTQREWGGSHDVILGHMIWLHDMPVYPVSSAYRSDRMRKGSLEELDNNYSEILEQAILIHDVKGEIGMVSHTDVHNFYKNLTAAKRSKANTDASSWARVQSDELTALGKKTYKQAIINHAMMKEETTSLAAVAFKKKFNLTSEFHLFKHFHCDPDFFMS